MHGTLTFDAPSSWRIACEPHVRARLKRVFACAEQRAAETITISHNDINARDLVWFMDRYPLTVDARAQSILAASCARHERSESDIRNLLDLRSPPADFELALPARQYQRIAVSAAMVHGGILVADDVGLGKTITGICAMSRREHLPALVVTLAHLPSQWVAELNRFAPQLKVHVLKSATPYELCPKPKQRTKSTGLFVEDGHETDRLPDVIVCNYHKLNGWADILSGLVHYVVFDEVQELRHAESKKYWAAKMIAAKAQLRIGLSATPIYNQGIEFFNVLSILRPDALGTRAEFVREWCQGGDRITDPKAFGTYLRREGLMVRRTRTEVGRELPPLSKVPQSIDCDTRALDAVKTTATELAKIILSTTQHARGEKMHAAEEFNMLMRQATGIAKALYVASFVRMLLSTEKKVVLFGWHRSVYDLWIEHLEEFNPMLYTGSENAAQKQRAKDAFVSGDCQLLIISLRAGAGLDGLQTVCSTAVFGELDWSPGVHEQCIGRIFRDGQKAPVMAYFMLANEGADPIIADVLGLKKSQIDGVRDPSADIVESLESGDGNIRKMAQSYLDRQ